MDSAVDYAKRQLLLEMYGSVERMNEHILKGNSEGAISEQALQVNLRTSFEELQNGRE